MEELGFFEELSLKRIVLGVILGGAATIAVGFNPTAYSAGWFTDYAAKAYAKAESAKAVADFFAPDCAAGVRSHADSAVMLVAMSQAKDDLERRRAFKGPVAEKLVMLPRQTYGNSELINACVKLALSAAK
jgi:hypothetical protein